MTFALGAQRALVLQVDISIRPHSTRVSRARRCGRFA